jgi:hypothetical protein
MSVAADQQVLDAINAIAKDWVGPPGKTIESNPIKEAKYKIKSFSPMENKRHKNVTPRSSSGLIYVIRCQSNQSISDIAYNTDLIFHRRFQNHLGNEAVFEDGCCGDLLRLGLISFVPAEMSAGMICTPADRFIVTAAGWAALEQHLPNEFDS